MLAFAPCLVCFGAILWGKQTNIQKPSLGQTLGENQEGVQVCVTPGLGNHSPQDMECQPSPAEQHSSDILEFK